LGWIGNEKSATRDVVGVVISAIVPE